MSSNRESRFPYLEWVIIFMLANTLAVLAYIGGHAFTFGDFIALGYKAAVLGIVALGVLVVFYVNEYDFSVGSIFALCLITVVSLERWISPLVTWVLVFGLIGLIGYVNGWFTATLRSGLLITFVMMFILQGISDFLSNGMSITHVVSTQGSLLYAIGWQSFLGLPIATWVFFGMAMGLHVFFYHSTWGRSIRAIGIDNRVAQDGGLNTRAYKIGAFIFAAEMAGIASILYYARLQTVNPDLGVSIPFDALAIVIISNGGTKRRAPSLVRLLIVTFLLAEIYTQIEVLGLLPNTRFLLTGFLILYTLLLRHVRSSDQIEEERRIIYG
ncbi:MAG TPA: ABC transporter permease [Nitrospira sp.]|nr:ABC transporter permease [Nitrospira sp.]